MLDGAESMSEAAQRLHMSQQGFSKAIAALERAVGARLVDRGARGSILTIDGRAFLGHARAAVEHYRAGIECLRTQKGDLDLLKAYDGPLNLTSACFVALSRRYLDSGILESADVREVSLEDAFSMAGDGDAIVIADVCPEVYPDFERDFILEPIGVGRVGIVAGESLLPKGAEDPLWESAARLPIGMYDCDASLEIYEKMFEDMPLEAVKMRTRNAASLQVSALRGKVALLCDTFSWAMFPEELTRDRSLRFIPLRKEMNSVFGFLRRRDVPFTDEQRVFVDSFLRILASLPEQH